MRALAVAAVAAALSSCAPQCHEERHGGQFCLPDGGAPAGVEVTVELLDVCSFSCGAQGRPTCVVTRNGGEVWLEGSAQVCELPPNTACNASCALSRMRCALGALDPGSYVVRSGTEPARQLTVAPDAGSTACAVVFP